MNYNFICIFNAISWCWRYTQHLLDRLQLYKNSCARESHICLKFPNLNLNEKCKSCLTYLSPATGANQHLKFKFSSHKQLLYTCNKTMDAFYCVKLLIKIVFSLNIHTLPSRPIAKFLSQSYFLPSLLFVLNLMLNFKSNQNSVWVPLGQFL